MNKKRLGVIGLGTVGRAFVSEFKKNRRFLKKNLELDIAIKKICDTDLRLRKMVAGAKIPFTANAEEIIRDKDIDIVVELIGGINPAKKYVISALKNGKDVVTANKALLAEAGKDIFNLAYKNDKTVGFEAAVAGGVPLIKSVSEVLRFGRIKSVYGILNGTTNFILSQMSRYNKSYKQSLKDAKLQGIAEKDSSLDVSGKDSLHKIALLCFLCFGKFPNLKNVLIEGISGISNKDIKYAEELGYSIKLLAVAKKNKDIEIRVHPALIETDHPLSETEGVLNSIYVNTGTAGSFFFSGLGAGGKATALSVLSDVITASGQKKFYALKEADEKFRFKKKNDFLCRYYIRFSALDKPGVLAKISRILSDYHISIASVTQKDEPIYYDKSKFVPIVMLTHEANERNMYRAIRRIDKLGAIKTPTQLIRIEKACK